MKEQSEKLFRAIGDVGDDLIARADAPVKKAPRVWVKWAALAACCALVIGAAAFVVPMFHAGSSAPETAWRSTVSALRSVSCFPYGLFPDCLWQPLLRCCLNCLPDKVRNRKNMPPAE